MSRVQPEISFTGHTCRIALAESLIPPPEHGIREA